MHVVRPFPHSGRLRGTTFGSNLVSVLGPAFEKKGGPFLVLGRCTDLYCFLTLSGLWAQVGGKKMAALLGPPSGFRSAENWVPWSPFPRPSLLPGFLHRDFLTPRDSLYTASHALSPPPQPHVQVPSRAIGSPCAARVWSIAPQRASYNLSRRHRFASTFVPCAHPCS